MRTILSSTLVMLLFAARAAVGAVMLPADSVYIDAPAKNLDPGRSTAFPLLFLGTNDEEPDTFDARVLTGPGAR